ncbi:MAG: 16S rRNA (uracil(1498)-N(3))-methyltransferase [Chloroflexi bacterium]|nr:16S rRNA (uracil(1498)-N(3))-methyltransferase [Chloroflexota bacterium]
MHRFFVPPEVLHQEPVVLGRDLAHRLGHVLRLRPGEKVVLLDNTGWEYQGEITRWAQDRVELRLIERRWAGGEPGLRVHLYQGVLKGDKFKLVLQKGTELGLASFTPLPCHRRVAQPPSPGVLARWRKIVLEAAEQSRRGIVPPVHPPLPLEEALPLAPGLRLLLWEGEGASALREALEQAGTGAPQPSSRKVSLFIGPEGGWDEAEVALAVSLGAVPVGLGPRILRAETAGLVAAAAILFHAGELGS